MRYMKFTVRAQKRILEYINIYLAKLSEIYKTDFDFNGAVEKIFTKLREDPVILKAYTYKIISISVLVIIIKHYNLSYVLDDLEAVSGINKLQIYRTTNRLAKHLNIDISDDEQRYKVLLTRYFDLLHFPVEHQQEVREFIETHKDKFLMKHPINVVLGILYIFGIIKSMNGKKMYSQEYLAEKGYTTAQSIRNFIRYLNKNNLLTDYDD